MAYGTNPEPACSLPGHDPEWWVSEHPGKCSGGCAHGLAAHICLNHCPVVAQCQEVAAMNPDMWSGMVMGGRIWDPRPRKREFVLPLIRSRCGSCVSELALV